jgi:hypothetical protein
MRRIASLSWGLSSAMGSLSAYHCCRKQTRRIVSIDLGGAPSSSGPVYPNPPKALGFSDLPWLREPFYTERVRRCLGHRSAERPRLSGGTIALGLMRGVMTWPKSRGAQEVLFHVTSGVEVAHSHKLARRLGFALVGGGVMRNRTSAHAIRKRLVNRHVT